MLDNAARETSWEIRERGRRGKREGGALKVMHCNKLVHAEVRCTFFTLDKIHNETLLLITQHASPENTIIPHIMN